jgi:hypothetical protein
MTVAEEKLAFRKYFKDGKTLSNIDCGREKPV